MRSTPRTSSLIQKRNLERIAHSANEANVMLKEFTDHPSDTYQLLLKIAGQIAFESALAPARRKAKLPHRTIVEFTKLLIATERKSDRKKRKS